MNSEFGSNSFLPFMKLTKATRIEIATLILLWTIFFSIRLASGQALVATILDLIVVNTLFIVVVFHLIASIPDNKQGWYVQTIKSALFYLLLCGAFFYIREYLVKDSSAQGYFFGNEQSLQNSAWFIFSKHYLLAYLIYFSISLAYGFIRKFVSMPYINPAPVEKYLVIKSGSETYRIRKDKITFVKGEGNYLSVHWENRYILSLLSFDEVMKMLDAHNFIRVHRSYIVNVDLIEQVNKDKIIIGDQSIPISKSYRPDLRRELRANSPD